MKVSNKRIDADFVIAGGGIPGICAALQAARMGLKTVLINNRTAFGGNGSAELMINICGATGTQEFNYNARETGAIEDLLLENYCKNPNGNRWLWDGIIYDKLLAEPNIMLFPNTFIDEVILDDQKNIKCICGTQNTTEIRYSFYAPVFADDTGDGTVAFLSGAEFHYGRESKDEYGERIAPEKADNCVIPSTMVFFSEKRDRPVPYKAPSFATDFNKSNVFQYREIPKNGFDQFVWFYEIDGKLDQIGEAETILHHHRQFVYGIWDYIKNSGKFPAENHELSYISPIMGKRESRRFIGDYVLKEQDLLNQTDFPDAVGHGGWSIDLHAIDGFYAKEPVNRHVFLDGVYQIPYRASYSKDINNLFLMGRIMSASHIAFGSIRVMATLATMAQADAVAAFICKKYNCKPRDIYTDHLDELQQLLLKYDQYVIGKKYEDSENLAAKAKINVSSVRKMGFTDGNELLKLENDYGLSIPVISHFGGIKLFGKAENDTVLKYTLYKASKPENYNPDTPVFSGETVIKKSDTIKEILLPADCDLKSGFYFLRITKNEEVSLKWGERRLTEAVTSRYLKNNSETNIDAQTLEPMVYKWTALNGENLCFEPVTKEAIFDGNNLINGYSRPYILPNAWQSEKIENEYIELSWDNQTEVSELVLIFDSNLNEYLKNEYNRKEPIRQSLVKDFTVSLVDNNGNYNRVKAVTDNYQRFVKLSLEKQKTKSLRIDFKATNGLPYISVFDVRVY